MTCRTFHVPVEYAIEIFPGVDSIIMVETRVSLSQEPFGEDADGRRGGLQTTIDEIELFSIRLYCPDRPTLLICTNEEEVRAFLTKDEYDSVVDTALEKAFVAELENLEEV